MKYVYADYNATTPLNVKVLEAMLPYLRDRFGNASSVHIFGREARAAIDEARTAISRILRCQEHEIVFTGSGTESNNQAIFGVVRAASKKHKDPPHIICSAIEHHAVIHVCQYLQKRGECDVTVLSVNQDGLVESENLRAAIRPKTILVSIMTANNETGTIQPTEELSSICHDHGVLFHTDAVQTFGKQNLDIRALNPDLLSISGHKFYGPKGIGLLYVKKGTVIDPILFGGTHENERRAGTENVATIVGIAKAAEVAVSKFSAEQSRLFDLTEKFAQEVQEKIPLAFRNGHPSKRIANTVNFSFQGCSEEGLLLGLDLEGVAASSGSACAVGSLEPSHVLAAMGVAPELARAAVRFSFGDQTTEEDIQYILNALSKVVERIRRFGG